MDAKQIIRHIDDGANFYLRQLGNAEHMEYEDNGFFSYIKPKSDEQEGVRFIFDIRLDGLSTEVQKTKVAEIKALQMPSWLSLLASSELYTMMFGKDKEPVDTDDEAYMALLPEEKPEYLPHPDDVKVVKVETAEAFQLWAKNTNDIISRGFPDVHPVNHYHICEENLMTCYICYKNDIPSAFAAILNNNGIASLEFVATIPEMRKQGLAKAVCSKAIDDCFEGGGEIITVRAIVVGEVEEKLYQALGFKAYNFAL